MTRSTRIPVKCMHGLCRHRTSQRYGSCPGIGSPFHAQGPASPTNYAPSPTGKRPRPPLTIGRVLSCVRCSSLSFHNTVLFFCVRTLSVISFTFQPTRAGLLITLILFPALYADPPLIGSAASVCTHNWRPALTYTRRLTIALKILCKGQAQDHLPCWVLVSIA